MAKDFLTYDQQIDRLVNEKGLVVSDRGYAIEILKRTSYFVLVNGYKQPLKDPITRKYKPGTEFADIVALFEFDARLRSLFMEVIARVERKLRSFVSYAFCSREDSAQRRYLDPASYSDAKKYRNGVAGLIRIMEGERHDVWADVEDVRVPQAPYAGGCCQTVRACQREGARPAPEGAGALSQLLRARREALFA